MGQLSGPDGEAAKEGVLVGHTDNIPLSSVARALAKEKITGCEQLAYNSMVDRVIAAAATDGTVPQQIRSQVILGQPGPTPTPLPIHFQLFGQRFLIDSFVLAKVVFDSIVHDGRHVERLMPSGLDVMAALGNDEAVRLLEPELGKYPYASNLLSAHRVVEGLSKQTWRSSLCSMWLDTLRPLPAANPGPHFPAVMRSVAWQRKQLRTQLGSWAELRHDTLLYAKQSYTTRTREYPEGYVAPYPAFFSHLSELAQRWARRLSQARLEHPEPDRAERMGRSIQRQVEFLQGFVTVIRRLQALATKELAGEPFSDEETAYLKKTMDRRGGGSGSPRYDGWYPGLVYGRHKARFAPTVADVHTDPNRGNALEAATGRTNYLVIAIDNEKHRTVYVGPAYSYYEFQVPASDRLTDGQWSARLSGPDAPDIPSWSREIQPDMQLRDFEHGRR